MSKTARATQWNSKLRYLGLFAQDDWKITPRLTLNLGVRYEVESALKQSDDGGLGFDLASGTMLISEHIKTRPFVEDFYRNVRPDIPIRFVPQRSPYDPDTNNLGVRFRLRLSCAAEHRASRRLRNVLRFATGAVARFDERFRAQHTSPDLDLESDGSRTVLQSGRRDVKAESTLRQAPLTIFPFLSRDFPYGKVQQWLFSVQQQLPRAFWLK